MQSFGNKLKKRENTRLRLIINEIEDYIAKWEKSIDRNIFTLKTKKNFVKYAFSQSRET